MRHLIFALFLCSFLFVGCESNEWNDDYYMFIVEDYFPDQVLEKQECFYIYPDKQGERCFVVDTLELPAYWVLKYPKSGGWIYILDKDLPRFVKSSPNRTGGKWIRLTLDEIRLYSLPYYLFDEGHILNPERYYEWLSYRLVQKYGFIIELPYLSYPEDPPYDIE